MQVVVVAAAAVDTARLLSFQFQSLCIVMNGCMTMSYDVDEQISYHIFWLRVGGLNYNCIL